MLVAIVAPQAQAQAQYRLTKVLDLATPIPGGTGNFTGITDIAYDGRAIAFRGWINSGPQGIYLWKNGELSKVADKSTSVPSGGGLFTTFGEFSLDGGHVAFEARGSATTDGVYTTLGGSLRTVADKSTFVPGSNARFSTFYLGDVAIDGDEVSFTAFGSSSFGAREGLYRESSGTLSKVADRTTTVVDSTKQLTFFGEMDAAGGQAIVKVDGNLYTTLGAPAGQLRTVYEFGTPLPGLANASTSVSPTTLGIDGSDIAFYAVGDNSRSGLYLERSGAVEPIATHDTVSPLTGETFTRLTGTYSMSAGEVAFWGQSGSSEGLFVNRRGELNGVVHRNMSIGGKTVDRLFYGQESLKNGRMVFGVEFFDNTGAIYLAERTTPTAGPSRATFSTGVDGDINGSTITANGTSLTVLKNAASNADRRAVIEFNLSTLPAGATINTAELEITTGNVAAGSSMAVFGYEGDAGIRLADFSRRDWFLGESPLLTSSTTQRFHLDPAAVQSILADSSRDVLGLALIGGYDGSQVVFSAMESNLAARPKLYISYTGPSPADFNDDGVVNGADLDSWRSGFGQGATATSPGNADGDSDVDGADFLVWQRAVSASSPPAVATPEPSYAVLMASVAIAWRRAAKRFGRTCL